MQRPVYLPPSRAASAQTRLIENAARAGLAAELQLAREAREALAGFTHAAFAGAALGLIGAALGLLIHAL